MDNRVEAEAIRQMIAYLYLAAYCPASHMHDLETAAQAFREDLAEQAGLEPEEFYPAACSQAAWRVVAFHQATREPDEVIAQELFERMVALDGSAKTAAAYHAKMEEIAAHPGRAKASNRLHRRKGCDFCTAPCQYGYFTLVSEPDFKLMRAMLEKENEKPVEERNVVNVLWTFTSRHLWSVLGVNKGYIRVDHLGNLSYCLLMLATAKSRFALKEPQLKKYQALNQRTIAGWRPVRLEVSPSKVD